MTINAPVGAASHRNLELLTNLVQRCWDPPRPHEFARFSSSLRARALFTAFAVAFPDARLHVSWVVADEQRAAMGGRIEATHGGPWRGVEGTGRRIDVAFAVSLSIAAGDIVEISTLSDSLALAEQIGAVSPLEPPACRMLDGAERGR